MHLVPKNSVLQQQWSAAHVRMCLRHAVRLSSHCAERDMLCPGGIAALHAKLR